MLYFLFNITHSLIIIFTVTFQHLRRWKKTLKYSLLGTDNTAEQISDSTSDSETESNEYNIEDENNALLIREVLFESSLLEIGWNTKGTERGIGLLNMGNTCYMNASIQAIYKLPVFINWLHSDAQHRNLCQQKSK